MAGCSDDLTLQGSGMIYRNGSWSAYDVPTTTAPATTAPVTQPATTAPATEPATTTPVSKTYVYAKGYTHAYMWSNGNPDIVGAWPGKTMESIGNGVYRIKVPDGATSIIFSNSGNNQTADLTINAGKLYENGSWSDYNA